MTEPALRMEVETLPQSEEKQLQPKRTRRWWLRGTVTVTVLLVICLVISTVVGWQLSHPVKQPVYETPAKYGLAYEDIEFVSEVDAVPLKGWFLPAAKPNGTTVIIAHGYKKNRLQDDVPLMPYVKTMTGKGYQFLMFDFRNCGESGGDKTTVGKFEQLDLLGAVRTVKERTNDKIVLHGFSMGAATSLLAAAQSPDVKAVVADSPFSSLNSYLDENLSYWSNLPRYPFTPMMMAVIPYFIGANASEVEPQKAIEQIYPRPILFIHGTGDKAIPHQNSILMSDKHPDQFELWITDEAAHVRSYSKYPEQYVDRVDEFLRKVAAK